MSKFDVALKRLLNNLKLPASKIEGTFSTFNLRSVAMESALLENNMEIMENNWSLDTAQGAYLDAKVRDIGLFRHLAAFAYGNVVFTGNEGVVIPTATKVAATEYGVEFYTNADATIHNGEAVVEAVAIESGFASNVPAGSINKIISKVQGVKSVTNPQAFDHGTEREDDANLRKRAYFVIRNPHTSGNVNDYKSWALDNKEVGAVKVFPLWNGAGTVKVSIVTMNGTPASPELIQDVQDYIDPEAGRGYGKAPVGATVTVTTAARKDIAIVADITIDDSTTLEKVKKDFSYAITERLKEIAYDGKTRTISPARIGYYLIETQGVIDYTNLTVNGDIKAIIVGDEEVAMLSDVTLS